MKTSLELKYFQLINPVFELANTIQDDSLRSSTSDANPLRYSMCGICGKLLSSKNAAFFHYQLHNIDCEICGQVFTELDEYYIHHMQHSSFDTDVIVDISYSPNELVQLSNGETFSLFAKENPPLRNLTWVSIGVNNVTCKKCNLTFSTRQSLYHHNLSHSQDKLATCNFCGKSFLQSEDFISLCSENCRVKYLSSMCLMPDEKMQTKIPLYKCNECPKSFGSQGNLNRHKLIHGGVKNYLCDICHEAFTQRIALQKHYLIHAEIKPYVCEFCEKTFSSKTVLIEHRQNHRNENRYKCFICGIELTGKRNFKRHSLEHLPGQSSSCHECGKSFATKKKLQFHLLIHSENRPFKCNICDRGFTYSSHLKRHYLSHTGERPYACGICGETFIAKYSLTYHLNKHKREEED